MAVDVITLPKDCRGLMYHAPAIIHAGVFDATKTTNFGAKKGSWQEAFGGCISLTSLYIQNLKTSINISWSPINADSIEFIVNNAINTSTITISVSPYTWNIINDELIATAKAKNINIVLLEGNMPNDKRWNKVSSDILTLQSKIVPVTVEADGLMPKSMLGTDVATKELGNYVEIKHNYNESYLLIPKATSEIAGVMSPEDKSKIDNVNINSPIAYAVYDGTSADVVVTTTTGYFPTELVAGARITIKITGNIGLIKTLNVNGTGVKNVYYSGNSMTSGMIDRYNVYDFIFDGTYYRILGVDTDTNTHYNAKIVAGASATSKTNDNAENGNVYLNVIENSTVRSSHNIVGEGDVSVRSDVTGRIIIESRVGDNLRIDVTPLLTLSATSDSKLIGYSLVDLTNHILYSSGKDGDLGGPVKFYPTTETTGGNGGNENSINSFYPAGGYLIQEAIQAYGSSITIGKWIIKVKSEYDSDLKTNIIFTESGEYREFTM